MLRSVRMWMPSNVPVYVLESFGECCAKEITIGCNFWYVIIYVLRPFYICGERLVAGRWRRIEKFCSLLVLVGTVADVRLRELVFGAHSRVGMGLSPC